MIFTTFSGRCVVLSKLCLDPSRLARMGLPKVERSLSPLQGNDPRRHRLSDVASFRKGIITSTTFNLNAFQKKDRFILKTCRLYLFQGTEERNHDLVQVYKSYFSQHVNPTNLALLIDSYARRTDLNIARGENDGVRRRPGVRSTTLSMPVINITGSMSPHVDDTVTLNGRLDPTNSSWMKVHKSDESIKSNRDQIYTHCCVHFSDIRLRHGIRGAAC